MRKFLILFSCIFLISCNFQNALSGKELIPKNYERLKEKAREKLSRVKVIVLYDRITDGKLFNREYGDIIKLLKETKADFIFLSFERAKPLPLSPDESYGHFTTPQLKYFAKLGLTYKQFEEGIKKIKEEIPDIIICGGILPQILFSRERDPVTLEIFDRDQTWKMALNPQKWGIPVSKEELQSRIGIREGKGRVKNPKEHLSTFYPDITNSQYQKLLIDWAKKQIDCGVDALWFDMLLGQVNILKKLLLRQGLTEKEIYNHPAIKESYEAMVKVLKEIREYGYKKYNKYIYLGMWSTIADIPYQMPELDFIYASPMTREEILNLKIDEERWDEEFSKIRRRFGKDIPIYVYISWGHTTKTQLGTFSQKLSKEKQRKYIELVDNFCKERRVNYIYPLHGGFMGIDAKILSYGKYPLYDSLAPEFDTYETIKILARKKAEGKPLLRTKATLDVVDLREKDYKTRLLILSLQGIVNRDNPKLYVLWESKDKFGNPSQEWLKYYKSKDWIYFKEISVIEAIKKYKDRIKGFVVYDPDFKHSINIATTMAGLKDAIIAHPHFIRPLKKLGLKMVEDLRGRWKDKYQAYKWQLINLFPECNKNFIAVLPVEDPRTHKFRYYMVRPIRDYVIMNKICALDLIPHKNFPRDIQLLSEYYKKINPYGIVLGYPFSGVLERPYVEFASKHKLKVLLAHTTSVNFSVHSKIPAKKIYTQNHVKRVNLKNKIYIAFCMSDLGLNTMQDRHYGAWDDQKRGSIPVSWWLDAIVIDFCPGIVQYYYETKTENDFFYGAHVAGRIRPSDFPDLEEYLRKGKPYLKRCDLNTVAFSNHGKYDEYVFKKYSKILDNCIGFFYGWMPEWEFGEDKNLLVFEDKVWIVTSVGAEKDVKKTVKKISSFIQKHRQRPLFMTLLVVLGNYPDFKFLKEVKENIEKLYPGQIEWVRGDELILLATQFVRKYRKSFR
ncbi:MAG: hypothetical protein DRP67_01670 [Candidatus Omnitrophota bacterium]|nr:MAG: hypothetical protein DRP67_01670 [Candidatus Omnitrophota bacterium]